MGAWPRYAKLTPPGAAGSTVYQNWAKTLPEGGRLVYTRS
jgi:hypothetical protein